MNTTNSAFGTVSKQNTNFYAGAYGQNGVKVTTQKVNTSGITYKDVCFHCGKPKSQHKLFQGCPK